MSYPQLIEQIAHSESLWTHSSHLYDARVYLGPRRTSMKAGLFDSCPREIIFCSLSSSQSESSYCWPWLNISSETPAVSVSVSDPWHPPPPALSWLNKSLTLELHVLLCYNYIFLSDNWELPNLRAAEEPTLQLNPNETSNRTQLKQRDGTLGFPIYIQCHTLKIEP